MPRSIRSLINRSRYGKRNIWRQASPILMYVGDCIKNEERDWALKILWMFYRDDYIPTDIDNTDERFRELVAATKTEDAEFVRETVLQLIIDLELDEVEENIAFIERNEIEYLSNARWYIYGHRNL